MSYEVVRYRPELKPEVTRLQTHLWSSDPQLNVRYFEWKFEQNPYVHEPNVYLALMNGRAVGMRGLYDSRWEFGPCRDEFAPLVADDMVVDPEHSNRRLVSQIMTAAFADARERGYTHLLNLSGSPVTVFGSLAMGWKSAGSLEPVRRTSHAGAGFRRARALMSRMRFLWRFARSRYLQAPSERRPFDHLDRLGQRGLLPGGISLDRRPRPDAMAALVEELGYDERLRHVRDARYFGWRFNNPLSEYRFLFCGAPRLNGYLVLCRHISDRANRTRVHISDLEGTDADVRARLLRCAATRGRFRELFTWSVALPAGLRPVLHDTGFEPAEPEKTARGVPCVLVRPVYEDPGNGGWLLDGMNLLDLTNWDMRLIYSMAG